MLYEYVEYTVINFDYSDGEFNKTKAMIRQIKHEQWLKNKSKCYIYETNIFFLLHYIVQGIYLEQHKETAGGHWLQM